MTVKGAICHFSLPTGGAPEKKTTGHRVRDHDKNKFIFKVDLPLAQNRNFKMLENSYMAPCLDAPK